MCVIEFSSWNQGQWDWPESPLILLGMLSVVGRKFQHLDFLVIVKRERQMNLCRRMKEASHVIDYLLLTMDYCSRLQRRIWLRLAVFEKRFWQDSCRSGPYQNFHHGFFFSTFFFLLYLYQHDNQYSCLIAHNYATLHFLHAFNCVSIPGGIGLFPLLSRRRR